MTQASAGLNRWQRLCITCAALTTAVVIAAVACGDDKSNVGRNESLRASVPSASASPLATPSTTAQPAIVRRQPQHHHRASTAPWAPLPGMPPIASPSNIYADAGANMLSRAAKRAPERVQ